MSRKAFNQDRTFRTLPKDKLNFKIQRIELHPVLDKIYLYEKSGIEQLLREHAVNDLVRIWHKECEPEQK